MSQGVDCDGFSTFDVPIFTEEFLDQNKGEVWQVLVPWLESKGWRGWGSEVRPGMECTSRALRALPSPALGSDSHPAAREAELRRLRKMNVAFEEQNAVLQRHTQSMSSARERLEQELALEERRTLALQQQLQAVRQALTASFASLPVPGAPPRPQSPPSCAPDPLRPFPAQAPPLADPLFRRHRGDADARDPGLLHGATARSHRA